MEIIELLCEMLAAITPVHAWDGIYGGEMKLDSMFGNVMKTFLFNCQGCQS